MPCRAAGIDDYVTVCVHTRRKGRCGDVRFVSAPAQSRRKIDGVSLRSAASGIGVENGEKDGQDRENKTLPLLLRTDVPRRVYVGPCAPCTVSEHLSSKRHSAQKPRMYIRGSERLRRR